MKALVHVPETELAVMTISFAAPALEPKAALHTTEVVEAHDAVEHA